MKESLKKKKGKAIDIVRSRGRFLGLFVLRISVIQC